MMHAPLLEFARRLCWLCVLVTALLAGGQLLITAWSAQGASQQAAGAAIAAAMAIIAYIFARAWEGMLRPIAARNIDGD